ncbi:MAG: carboxypeptidase-like regulatory domain-containing protein, partial [Acidobacteriia bacterium]|nr:carboxypeptidase-like regulatory domain-containing protein [Terriglobia bacterium]
MDPRNFWKLARVLLVLLFLALPVIAFAQAGSGELTGEVRDPSGALIANAKVTLTQSQTDLMYTAATTDGGVYVFSGLKPGRYSIAVETTGFKRYVQEDFNIATGERVHIDVALTIGSVSESVTVASDASPLRTESATMGQVIGTRTIAELPLNGRNFVSLAGLAAGVALPPAATPLPRLSGSRPRTNEYMYDGISVLQPEPGQIAFVPIIDAI